MTLCCSSSLLSCSSFFFNDTATTEIYTLSLHDALPILMRLPSLRESTARGIGAAGNLRGTVGDRPGGRDRKSTRLNSSHTVISYAVFCLKKKKKKRNIEIAKMNIKKSITETRRSSVS